MQSQKKGEASTASPFFLIYFGEIIKNYFSDLKLSASA